MSTSSLRIALAQVNVTVGDLAGNVRKVLATLSRARGLEADLVVFPELAVTGYPPEDLLLRPSFIAANQAAVEEIASATHGLTAVVGFADVGGAPSAWRRLKMGGDVYNAAALLHDGALAGVYHKHYLPTYGVFDEDRTFRAGADIADVDRASVPDRLRSTASRDNTLFVLGDAVVGVSVCEDIWYPEGPPQLQARGGAHLLVNISASPYHAGKRAARERMLATRAADNVAVVAFCNLVGGQDELVFDGGSVIFDERGELVARGAQFEEDLVVADVDVGGVFRQRLHDPRRRKEPDAGVTWVDLPRTNDHRPRTRSSPPDLPGPHIVEPLHRLEEIYSALVLGTRDYVRKNGFQQVVIGLSGGVDSSLVACVAADALGPENVTGVAMPSRYSADYSETDAARLAEHLGVHFLVIPIERAFRAHLDTLDEIFRDQEADVAEENLQARVRGNLLMALSNKFGWMVLTTGNKSEMSVGYATLYGDMAGGFAVIKDVPKTLVYELSRWRNERLTPPSSSKRRHSDGAPPASPETRGSRSSSRLPRDGGGEDGPPIPERVLTRPPSAELRPDQKDTDSLPPYDVLDPILEAYVEEDRSLDEIVALGFDESLVRDVMRMVDRNEYKRRQAPPGIKITPRAFGKDRRLPITNRFRP